MIWSTPVRSQSVLKVPQGGVKASKRAGPFGGSARTSQSHQCWWWRFRVTQSLRGPARSFDGLARVTAPAWASQAESFHPPDNHLYKLDLSRTERWRVCARPKSYGPSPVGPGGPGEEDGGPTLGLLLFFRNGSRLYSVITGRSGLGPSEPWACYPQARVE